MLAAGSRGCVVRGTTRTPPAPSVASTTQGRHFRPGQRNVRSQTQKTAPRSITIRDPQRRHSETWRCHNPSRGGARRHVAGPERSPAVRAPAETRPSRSSPYARPVVRLQRPRLLPSVTTPIPCRSRRAGPGKRPRTNVRVYSWSHRPAAGQSVLLGFDMITLALGFALGPACRGCASGLLEQSLIFAGSLAALGLDRRV